jgi:hypothetical protein
MAVSRKPVVLTVPTLAPAALETRPATLENWFPGRFFCSKLFRAWRSLDSPTLHGLRTRGGRGGDRWPVAGRVFPGWSERPGWRKCSTAEPQGTRIPNAVTYQLQLKFHARCSSLGPKPADTRAASDKSLPFGRIRTIVANQKGTCRARLRRLRPPGSVDRSMRRAAHHLPPCLRRCPRLLGGTIRPDCDHLRRVQNAAAPSGLECHSRPQRT